MKVLAAIFCLFIAGVLLRAIGEAVGKAIEGKEKAKAYRRLRRFRGWRQQGGPSIQEFLNSLQNSNQSGGQDEDSGNTREPLREDRRRR